MWFSPFLKDYANRCGLATSRWGRAGALNVDIKCAAESDNE
jgi:hypothetical protein